MRTARTEVSDRISVVPASRGLGEETAALDAIVVSGGSFHADAFLTEGLAVIAASAQGGTEDFGAAAAQLVNQASGVSAAQVARDLGEAFAAADPAMPASAICYDFAVSADSGGRTEAAILVLAALAATRWGEADGCLGLAVIAARMERLDAALVLARQCLKSDFRHPRAYCIVGICELDRGDVAAAQSNLAMAARLARSRPEFREDMQAAQRALLLMHLSA